VLSAAADNPPGKINSVDDSAREVTTFCCRYRLKLQQLSSFSFNEYDLILSSTGDRYSDSLSAILTKKKYLSLPKVSLMLVFEQ
jgi:hypothetical protein